MAVEVAEPILVTYQVLAAMAVAVTEVAVILEHKTDNLAQVAAAAAPDKHRLLALVMAAVVLLLLVTPL